MSIVLTPEQAAAVASGKVDRVVDPVSGRAYRLVPEEADQIDASAWTAEETGILAGEAFGRLDDTDYSEYLGDEK